MDDKDRIVELTQKLQAAREAYYNLAESTLPDDQYDALLDELKKLSPENAEVTTIGASVPQYTSWEKVRHTIPMGSLDKVKTPEEFLTWARGVRSENFLITHKIDGSSLEVIYTNGKLTQAITRGDGSIGEDVTINAVQIPSLPKIIDLSMAGITSEKISIRGEIVMMKSVFQEVYATEYANPRNTAAGKIRDKKSGGADCANLSFIAYTIMCDGIPHTEFFRFVLLKNLGFTVPECEAGPMDVMVQAHERIKTNRDAILYEIDGTVIRMNDVLAQEALGDLNMRPRGQIAWKFDPSMGVTKVIDIRWQVGPTGRLCPVAQLEPVQIGGVTITNVSLHNLKLFAGLQLWKGCEVLVSRRNDVIPFLEKNLDLEQF